MKKHRRPYRQTTFQPVNQGDSLEYYEENFGALRNLQISFNRPLLS